MGLAGAARRGAIWSRNAAPRNEPTQSSFIFIQKMREQLNLKPERRHRPPAPHVLIAAIGVVAGFAGDERAIAAPRPADALPASLLEHCDQQAKPFERYARTIGAAASALVDMGVFAEADFRGVKIGFCGLRGAQGPVATTACASDTILLDHKYDHPGQTLTLLATLSHEMKHYFQHRDRKAEFGANYCDSARYNADKPWMEAEADAFGDAVAELFVLGRVVEIVNDCPSPLSIVVEPDRPASAGGDALGFLEIAPHDTAHWTVNALSKHVRFYAETDIGGEKKIWRGETRANMRFVDGRSYRLTRISLGNQQASKVPFQLRLSSQAAALQCASSAGALGRLRRRAAFIPRRPRCFRG